jgi:hypothetical protein
MREHIFWKNESGFLSGPDVMSMITLNVRTKLVSRRGGFRATPRGLALMRQSKPRKSND